LPCRHPGNDSKSGAPLVQDSTLVAWLDDLDSIATVGASSTISIPRPSVGLKARDSNLEREQNPHQRVDCGLISRTKP
jgi:hypothetical protein